MLARRVTIASFCASSRHSCGHADGAVGHQRHGRRAADSRSRGNDVRWADDLAGPEGRARPLRERQSDRKLILVDSYRAEIPADDDSVDASVEAMNAALRENWANPSSVHRQGQAQFSRGAGFFAGFYIIPLQSLLQKLPPDKERGRFLGTANGISFGFLSIASLLYALIRPAFTGPTPGTTDRPERIFLISAVLMIVGSGFFLIHMSRRGISFRSRDAATEK